LSAAGSSSGRCGVSVELEEVVVAVISRHSVRNAARPRRLKRSMPIELRVAKIGSMIA
jgi:hypothetical protein